MKKYAIIGFGCAGYNAAKAIRMIDTEGVIDVYEKTVKPPFNPMLTTYYASERLNEQALFPFGESDEISRRLDLNMINNCTVLRIDAINKKVFTDADTEKQYDKILISTGARAFIPGFLRCEGNHVFLMRTLDDAVRLKTYLSEHKVMRAAVVGGSMVGIKVAELLYRRNIKTVMIDAAPYIFPLAAHKNIAVKIEDRLKSMGIGIYMDAKVGKISQEGVELADGQTIGADIVCLCVGTKANVELIANVDVVKNENVNINKGIVIDQHCMTSCSDIYAAGDCCEGMNLQSKETAIIGLWANAAAQGSCAGKNMAGIKTEYYGNILHNITHFFDVDFIGLGDPHLEGEIREFHYHDFDISVVMKGDRIQSINILGDYSISGILKNHLIKQLMTGESKLSAVQIGLLEKSGLSKEFIQLIGG